jgi:predicted alpha/beta superfamily hydrolase
MKHLQSLAAALTLILAPTLAVAEVTFRVTVPADTDPSAAVFIAGDFQSWNPGHPDYKLTPTGKNLWEIVLPLKTGQALQFKFTLGDWEHVEKGPGGEEIQNRLHKVAGTETLDLEVASWAHGDARLATKTGNITLITVPEFLDDRPVWVYLPPGYEQDTERRYPVLYMMDGQNVFDDATSFAGEWKVDETLEELIPAGQVEPLIVVAVANDGDNRTKEYTPWYSSSRETGGGGGKHLKTWIKILLPFINANYRTLTGPENTGLAGSSFGGLMALYGAYSHPDVFGKIGSFSPTVMYAGGRLPKMIADSDKPDIILYLDMGTREMGNFQDKNGNGIDDGIDSLRRLQEILTLQGFVGGWDLLVAEGEGHRHNEFYWSQRFPQAVQFLFPGGS